MAALAVACMAPGAGAAITTSTVTTPTDTAVGPLVYDGSHYPVTVAGTTNSTAPGTDQVDLVCYYIDETGARSANQLNTGPVGVNPDGTFSAQVDGESIALDPCLLLAVPHNVGPPDLSPFHGPRAHAALDRPSPNNGKYSDYEDAFSSSRGYFDLLSLGSDGLSDSTPFTPPSGNDLQQQARSVFYGNGYYPPDVVLGGQHRSGVQVDGADGFFASPASGIQPNGAWPGLTYTPSYDAGADRYTLVETDGLVRCPVTTRTRRPRTPTACRSARST
jgi:hypothetical protein